MSPHLHLVTVVLALVSVSQAQATITIFPNACPTVMPQTSVSLDNLEGTWYEQRRYPSLLENFQRCIASTFTTATTSSMTINTVMKRMNSDVQTTLGATITRTGTNGQFTYRIISLPVIGWPVDQDYDYKVVAVTTDYLVAWSCRNLFFGFSNEQILWILTRSRTPTGAVMDAAIDAATAQSIKTSLLITVEQTDC